MAALQEETGHTGPLRVAFGGPVARTKPGLQVSEQGLSPVTAYPACAAQKSLSFIHSSGLYWLTNCVSRVSNAPRLFGNSGRKAGVLFLGYQTCTGLGAW